MKNYREVMKTISSMKPGDVIYINAINLSLRSIDTIRYYIRIGVLVPDLECLKKMVIPEAIDDYMNGSFMAPQMQYTKNKCEVM